MRKREIANLTRAALIRTVNTVVAFSVPVLVTLAAFSAYVFWTNAPLDPGQMFVAISLFNVARFPLGILPLATKNVSEALVAAGRIAGFLSQPEVDADDLPVVFRSDPAAPSDGSEIASDVEPAVQAAGVHAAPAPGAAAHAESVGDTLQWLTDSRELPPPGVLLEARGASFAWPPTERQDGGGKPGGGKQGGGKPAQPETPAAAPAESPASAPAAPTLAIRDVSFTLSRGETVAIVGPVAAGKSSLLCSLLGQLKRVNGAFLQRNGVTVAYAGQSPWVFSGSLRDNVLMGSPFDQARYDSVLDACCLRPDLAILPSGDATEIGERGLNLSGGQKARVALARAVYADCDVLLADDPLSAVDVHVGRSLFEGVLGPAGMLAQRGRAVLLVTHQTQYLPQCSRVLVMEGGAVAHQGTFAELAAAGLDLLGAGGGSSSQSAQVDDVVEANAPAPKVAAAASAPAPTESAPAAAPAAASAASEPAVAAPPVALAPPTKPSSALSAGRLVVAEDRKVGALAGSTVAAYFRAAGGASIGILLLAILLVGKGSRSLSDWFLSYWAQNRASAPESWWLGMYAITVLGVLIMTLVQGTAFAVITLRASRHLHDTTFTAVMRAQPTWFDTQPTGRLLARFTGDLDSIDSALPSSIEQASEYLVQCLLAIVLIAAVFPWFLVALVPIMGAFWAIASIFRRAARELKRLDSMSRSPLVSHIAATSSGLVTIRAYGALPRYKAAAASYIDDSTKAYYSLYVSNRWVAIRLDFATAVVAFAAAILCAVNRHTLAPGLAGLVLSQSLQLAGILQFATRLTTECEAQLTAVERLNHYSDPKAVPREHLAVVPAGDASSGKGAQLRGIDDPRSCNALLADAELDALLAPLAAPATATAAQGGKARPASSSTLSRARFFPGWYPSSWHPRLLSAGWPSRGRISFEHVSLRYRPGLPLVLQDVSFTAPAGSRVGIVGRTGSGKSTTLLALLRYIELDSGRVCIDGIDTSRANVYHLRTSVSVIPQDPHLYAGTLRSNVDPFAQAADEEVATALAQAGVGELASPDAGGLARPIAAGGSNLSVGERQLVCLARALLRDATIVALDEATASTDATTDAAIQRTIRSSPALAGRTVITIAHRLHTVMDYDAVLVLEAGRVAEYDTPAALLGLARSRSDSEAGRADGLTGPRGVFAAMVAQTGPETAALLTEQARAAATARGEEAL